AATAGLAEFLQRHAAFSLQPNVNDGEVFFDGDDFATNNGAFSGIIVDKAVEQPRFKIFFRHSLLCQASSPCAGRWGLKSCLSTGPLWRMPKPAHGAPPP